MPLAPGTPRSPAYSSWLCFCLLVSCFMAGCGGTASAPLPETLPLPPLSGSDLQAPGPYTVETVQLTLEDTSRPTQPNGAYPGSPSRVMKTQIWFPGGSGNVFHSDAGLSSLSGSTAPFPLVVYSHGFMSYGSEARYVAEHIAGHGYVVVCPDYPLTWMFSPGRPNVADVVNQPGDVSFLIDTFLNYNRDPESPFFGLIDEERIGTMGLSLGGMTTFLASYHPTLRDPRVKAAAVFAGPGSMFTDLFYSHADVPVLLVYGDIDAIVDYGTNAIYALERAAPRATLVTLHGATHTAFADIIAVTMDWMDNPDLLGCAALESGLDLEVDFAALLGGAPAGVVQSETPYPCLLSPLPRAMRPSRQHELTRLAVFAFLESRFGENAAHRERSARYLRETLSEEFPEELSVR